jgi:hypothetical protein
MIAVKTPIVLAGLVALTGALAAPHAARAQQFPLPEPPTMSPAASLPPGGMPTAYAPPARSLKLAFNDDGTVSLSASNVTVREILSEWARQCGCYIVNWDKLTGGPIPVPVQYERESQKKVLESLLRQAAGYVLTPKRAGSTIVSNYETIYILATSAPVGGAYVPPAGPTIPVMTMPTPGSPEDEIPAVGGPVSAPPGMPAGPPMPGMPTAMPAGPGLPANTNQIPRPGTTPSVFVPIVPVGPAPNAPPVPGMPTNAPAPPSGMPVPIIPAPQNR